MLCRVGTPGSPPLGPREQFTGCRSPPFPIGQGSQQADVAGWKRIGLAQFTHGDVLRRPLSDTGEFTKLCDTFGEASSSTKDPRVRHDGRRQRCERRSPHPRQAERRQVGRRQLFRMRKDVGQAVRLEPGPHQALAMALHQFPRQADRGGHRDLLAEHSPNREPERVLRARNAQAWSRIDQRCQRGILGELRADRLWVCGQIEHASQARDDRWKRRQL